MANTTSTISVLMKLWPTMAAILAMAATALHDPTYQWLSAHPMAMMIVTTVLTVAANLIEPPKSAAP